MGGSDFLWCQDLDTIDVLAERAAEGSESQKRMKQLCWLLYKIPLATENIGKECSFEKGKQTDCINTTYAAMIHDYQTFNLETQTHETNFTTL